MTCTFVCDAPTPIGDNEKATQLFRIAQEAVTNAIKHGRAKTIRIELARQDDLLTLAILDDGVGLEPASPSTGLGLRIMNFRAEMIGAELTLKPGRKGGTKITCSLPVSD
jgi:two-component system CheB/CheR fusion protein